MDSRFRIDPVCSNSSARSPVRTKPSVTYRSGLTTVVGSMWAIDWFRLSFKDFRSGANPRIVFRATVTSFVTSAADALNVLARRNARVSRPGIDRLRAGSYSFVACKATASACRLQVNSKKKGAVATPAGQARLRSQLITKLARANCKSVSSHINVSGKLISRSCVLVICQAYQNASAVGGWPTP